jgi:hypothetical protein
MKLILYKYDQKTPNSDTGRTYYYWIGFEPGIG